MKRTLTITATGKEAEKNMLSITRDAMQCLHVVNGIDFEADHITIEAVGTVTVKSVYDVLPSGMNSSNSEIIVMPYAEWRGRDDMRLFHSTIHNGKFVLNDGTEINHYKINKPYGKCDFEEKRKTCIKVYIVAQKGGKLTTRKYCDWDFTERACVNDARNNNNNIAYANGFNRMRNYFDKSGYCTLNIHNDYTQRVKALKAERAKNAANTYDCTAETEKIRAEIRRISNVMSELFKIPTVENIRKADKAMNCVERLVSYFTSHEKYIMEKSYSSVNSIKRDIEIMENEIMFINNILAK